MAKYRILHVDDDPDIREIAVMSLELDPDFEVRSVGSGADAVTTSAAWKPHLVLLDMMMPIMDGLETLRAIRASDATSAVPVAFMTARTTASDQEHFKALGALGVVRKPFDPIMLAGEVRLFLD